MNLADPPPREEPTRIILIGESGTGKTGSLASLADAGYKLHILDFDNNYKILRSVCKNLRNIEVETFTDQYIVQGQIIVPSSANAYSKGLIKLGQWLKEYNTPENILVVDSLTMLSRAAMRLTLFDNKRLQMAPWDTDYGGAQNLIQNFISLLSSDSVRCHVIVIAHVKRVGGRTGHERAEKDKDGNKVDIYADEPPPEVQGLPECVGQALCSVIPRYFPNMLIARAQGGNRAIYTIPQGIVLAKTETLEVKPSYPISTGLASFFRAVQSKVTTPKELPDANNERTQPETSRTSRAPAAAPSGNVPAYR